MRLSPSLPALELDRDGDAVAARVGIARGANCETRSGSGLHFLGEVHGLFGEMLAQYFQAYLHVGTTLSHLESGMDGDSCYHGNSGQRISGNPK